MPKKAKISAGLGHVRLKTYTDHPCHLCEGTIPRGVPALACNTTETPTTRVYVCIGCLVNRGGPSLREMIADGELHRGRRTLRLRRAWVALADPFADDEDDA